MTKDSVMVTAQVQDLVKARELLDDLEALTEKYELIIDLKICQTPSLQECYRLP